MENDRGHFWYSRKAFEYKLKDAHSKSEKAHVNFCKLDSGQIVKYTEWEQAASPISKWDDLVYLGEGTYHHHEFV